MSQLGMAVMLSMMGDNSESVAAFLPSVGKQIATLKLGADDALHFEMADGYKFKLYDDGQSCCESRYMRTDDNLEEFVGATLTGAVIKESTASTEDEYGATHEIQFLEIQTDRGVFTMSSHNEHNGYYGGFNIRAETKLND